MKYILIFFFAVNYSFSQEKSTLDNVVNTAENIYAESKDFIKKSGSNAKNVTKDLLNDQKEKRYSLNSFFFSLNNSIIKQKTDVNVIFDEEFDIKSNTSSNRDLESVEITIGNQKITYEALFLSTEKYKVSIKLSNYSFIGEGTIEYIEGVVLKLYTDKECLIFSLEENKFSIENEKINFIYSGEQLKNKIIEKIKFLTYNNDEVEDIWVSTHAELKSKNSTKVRHFKFDDILTKNVKQLVVKTDAYVYLFKMDVQKIEINKEIISVRRVTRGGQANYFVDSPVEEVTYNDNYNFDTSESEYKECDLDLESNFFLWEVESDDFYVFEKYYYDEK